MFSTQTLSCPANLQLEQLSNEDLYEALILFFL